MGGVAEVEGGGRDGPWTPAAVGAAAQLACLLEAGAEKPGNVTPRHDFAGLTWVDLVRAAVAVGPELARAGERGVGATVLAAVEATRGAVGTNANLGIVLLLAPLARAAVRAGGSLRARVEAVLAELDVADAGAAYAAIRLAEPGGLGSAGEHDVADEPAVDLRAAMAAGAGHDRIAAEYAEGFPVTLERGVPALEAALSAGLAPRAAVVELFLVLLAALPDTLIARKRGPAAAREVSAAAAEVLAAGGVRSPAGERALAAFDASLRADGHALNPGTTADLCAAALFVAILRGSL